MSTERKVTPASHISETLKHQRRIDAFADIDEQAVVLINNLESRDFDERTAEGVMEAVETMVRKQQVEALHTAMENALIKHLKPVIIPIEGNTAIDAVEISGGFPLKQSYIDDSMEKGITMGNNDYLSFLELEEANGTKTPLIPWRRDFARKYFIEDFIENSQDEDAYLFFQTPIPGVFVQFEYPPQETLPIRSIVVYGVNDYNE